MRKNVTGLTSYTNTNAGGAGPALLRDVSELRALLLQKELECEELRRMAFRLRQSISGPLLDENAAAAGTNAGSSFLDADGTKYPLRPHAVRGFVDKVEVHGDSLSVSGWAYAPGSSEVAVRAFVRGALVASGVTQSPRPDVASALGIDPASRTAFELHARGSDFDEGVREMRVFAISTDGVASELQRAPTMSRGFGSVVGREELSWSDDERHLTLHDVRFATVHGGGGGPGWEPGENCVLFYKMRGLVDEYLDWMRSLPQPHSFERVVELGLFDGGSVPFWFEVLNPQKHLGVDISAPKKNDYLDGYLADPLRRDRVSLAWQLSQDDPRLLDVVREELGGHPIDFVVDDASHLYSPTRASLEMLFPLLRPGAYYVIEDWAWYHWAGFEESFANQRPLTDLVTQLIEICGTRNGWIDHVHTGHGFVAVRRGSLPVDSSARFSLDDAVYRHPR